MWTDDTDEGWLPLYPNPQASLKSPDDKGVPDRSLFSENALRFDEGVVVE